MDEATKQFRLQQWALAIRDQKQSGLSVNVWCEQHGISRDAFFYRQRAVKQALADSDAGKALLVSGPVFAEVKLPDSRLRSTPAECSAHAQRWPVRSARPVSFHHSSRKYPGRF